MSVDKFPKWLRVGVFAYIALLINFLAASIFLIKEWSEYPNNFHGLTFNPFDLIGFALSSISRVSAGTLFLTLAYIVLIGVVYVCFLCLYNFLKLNSGQDLMKQSKALPENLVLIGIAIFCVHSLVAAQKEAGNCEEMDDVSYVYSFIEMPNAPYEKYVRSLYKRNWNKTLQVPHCNLDAAAEVMKTGYTDEQFTEFMQAYRNYRDPIY